MAETSCEAFGAESPRFEEVSGREAVPKAASGAGKAPLEEEEEEEDHDTHFKGSGRSYSQRSLLLKNSPSRRLLRKSLIRSRR